MLFHDIMSAKISCEAGIGASAGVLVLRVVIVGGLQASTLETLCAWGRPACIVDVDGLEVVDDVDEDGASGVAADARLGIERVLRSLRTGGERLPSWVAGVGDFGGA